MVDTLFFVHSDGQVAESWAAEYRSHGWGAVSTAASSPDALGVVEQTTPVASIFLLDGADAESVHDLVEGVSADALAGHPLLVFVGGTPEDVERARAYAPRAVFVRPDELTWVLKRLVVRS